MPEHGCSLHTPACCIVFLAWPSQQTRATAAGNWQQRHHWSFDSVMLISLPCFSSGRTIPHLLAGWASPDTFVFFFILCFCFTFKISILWMSALKDSQQLLPKSSEHSACHSYNSKRLTVKKYSGARKYTIHSITKKYRYKILALRLCTV